METGLAEILTAAIHPPHGMTDVAVAVLPPWEMGTVSAMVSPLWAAAMTIRKQAPDRAMTVDAEKMPRGPGMLRTEILPTGRTSPVSPAGRTVTATTETIKTIQREAGGPYEG